MGTLKIVNGKIPNFKEKIFEEKDVFIEDGKIVDIGNVIKQANNTIDAKGCILSPGFIDIHMHEEKIRRDLRDPYFTSYYELKMGVTTCVGGNCGDNRQSVQIFKNYIDDYGAPVNYLSFIGHNYLRNKVGIEDRYRSATKNEIEKMQAIVNEKLSLGILGISYGIEYSPGIDFEELIKMANSLASDDYLLSAHYRNDGDKSVEAIKEMIEVSKETKIPMQISHIGSCSAFGHMKEALNLIKYKKEEGINIMADCYPYSAFASFIGSAVFDDGCFQRWNKTYNNILLTEEPYKNVRCTKEIFHKVRKEYPNMIVAAFVMNEEEIKSAIKSPYVFVASDSTYRKNMGHPRGAGSFPRVLNKYVKGGELELIDALWKMTKGPADRLKLNYKGEIEIGKDADITIFDMNKIKDKATFENPTLSPEGISHVIIGGEIAVHNNKILKGRLGQFIKYNKRGV